MSARSIGKLLALVAAVIAGMTAYRLAPESLPELTRTEFLAEVHAGHVRRIEIQDQEVILSESTTHGRFRTDFSKARDNGLPNELRALGIEVWFTKSPPGI
jgi:ATP-dependent Zn protease